MAAFFVLVGPFPEDEVPRAQLFAFQIDWQSIELLCLVPGAQRESEVFAKVLDDLSHESTAVEEEWGVLEVGPRFMLAALVGNTLVFLGLFHKFLSEFLHPFGV